MAATYPAALKVFNVFHDYTDLIMAHSVNEIHDEVLSIETMLGINPLANTPYNTFGGAIQDLYNNKAPTTHTHAHTSLTNDAVGDDHPQYILVNGTRGFTGPVAGKNAVNGTQLVPLAQLQSLGYQNGAQVSAAVNGALGNLMSGAAGGGGLYGSAPRPTWHIQGGLHSGLTDGDGRITMYFPTPYSRCLQAFTCTKLPPLAPLGGPPYAWIEAQVTLVYADLQYVQVQFSHDYSLQPGMWASFSWISIGV
jgi:hypothetical protein